MIYNITKFFTYYLGSLQQGKIYKETGVERRVGSSPTSQLVVEW